MKKISAKEILTESIKLYKQNFFRYIKMSGVLSLINIIISVLSNMLFDFGNSWVTIALGTLNMVVIVTLFYNYVRFYCAVINNIYNQVSNNEVKFNESFWYARRLAPKFLVGGIYLLGMIIVPLIIIFFAYGLITSPILKWSVIGLAIAMGGFMLVRYYFIIYIRTIEPDTKNFITRGILLLKGNYISYFVILLITFFYSTAYGAVMFFVNTDNFTLLENIIRSSAYNIINIFIIPIIIVSNVLVYQKLVAK
ncbi:MAG: hypothetical protein JXQ23_07845 [Clostridia bacterium]|nr:hypothetical protein [Clostridia bacterium]